MDWYLFYVFLIVLSFIFFLTKLPINAQASSLPHGKVSVEFIDSDTKKSDGKAGSQTLRLRLYLPANYDEDQQLRYPVLYLLPGYVRNLDDTQWDNLFAVLDKLIPQGDLPAFIAVSPLADDSKGIDSVVNSDDDLDIISDLIPYLDLHYRTLSDRDNRLICGIGAGGYDALCLSLKYPQLFEACVLLNAEVPDEILSSIASINGSGALTERTIQSLLQEYIEKEARVRFYMFAGEDWDSSAKGQSLDQKGCKFYLEQQAVELYTALHKKNLFNLPFEKGEKVPGNEAQLRIKSGCFHPNLWLEGFENGLRFLFSQPESVTFSPRKTEYQAAQKGRLSEVISLQTSQGTNFDYRVYTPFGFQKSSDVQYPVLYLLHGSHGTASSWDDYYTALDWMIEQKLIKPLIAVAPVTGNSYWMDSQAYGAVESTVINHLIPKIDKMYPTRADRFGRALAGFSMGGFGAVYYAMQHPELFSSAVLLSPFVQDAQAPATSRAATGGVFVDVEGKYDDNLWRKSNYPELLRAYSKKAPPLSIYIYAGDDDYNHLSAKRDLPPDAWRYNMEYQAVQLYSALKNQAGNLAVTDNHAQLQVVDGGHDKTIWIQGFVDGLQYIQRQGFGA